MCNWGSRLRRNVVPVIVFLLGTGTVIADEVDSAWPLSPPLPEIQTSEMEQLRQKLQIAEREIERLRGGNSLQQVSWLQSDAQPGGGTAPDAGGGGGAGGGNLASRSQNPISDLSSIPFQSNFDFGIDPGSRTRFVGNLQPVIPVKLNEDWSLIQRLIVPFVNAPIGPDARSDSLGDSLLQFFFSPRNSQALIWGIGPNVLLPTASDSTLGVQEWGVGLNGVALVIQGPIVAGVLVSQVWSVDGNTKPFLAQPFFNYNLPQGWFLSASGEANADWELPSRRRWTVPFGVGFGRVFPIFGQPMNISTRFAPFLEKPPGGPDWQFRFQVTYLFPK